MPWWRVAMCVDDKRNEGEYGEEEEKKKQTANERNKNDAL
jgi:hypothetical protein